MAVMLLLSCLCPHHSPSVPVTHPPFVIITRPALPRPQEASEKRKRDAVLSRKKRVIDAGKQLTKRREGAAGGAHRLT